MSIITEFKNACKRAAQEGLVLSSSGNFSMLVPSHQILITASGACLGTITEDQIASVNYDTGESDIKPSSEIKFHRGIYRARPGIRVILHFQSPYATTIACSKDPYNFNVIPEVPAYIGDVEYIPYLTPGSDELANAVIDAMRESNVGLMGNHGVIAIGSTIEKVFQRALFLELACRILLTGKNLSFISEEECNKIKEICYKA